MKIIFLNCWYLEVKNKMIDFLKKHKSDETIFCFTEVDTKIVDIFKDIFSDFGCIYDSSNILTNTNNIYGQVIFYPKKFKLINNQIIKIFRNHRNDVGFNQVVLFKYNSSEFWISNIHGKARPGHKMDTPARIRQSKIVIDFLKDKTQPKIVGGDFNLLPEAKSVLIFEKNGYLNLVKEFKIKSTRGKLNRLNYQNKEVQEFADYCFVSKDIKVIDFKVPDVLISDHLPLILDFQI